MEDVLETSIATVKGSADARNISIGTSHYVTSCTALTRSNTLS